MEQDILKKQLEALNEAKRSKNVAVCDQTITVINEYFDLPKSTNETSKSLNLNQLSSLLTFINIISFRICRGTDTKRE